MNYNVHVYCRSFSRARLEIAASINQAITFTCLSFALFAVIASFTVVRNFYLPCSQLLKNCPKVFFVLSILSESFESGSFRF